MRNVWCIPALSDLSHWLTRAGFVEPLIVSNVITTTDEQRSTPWMTFESLEQALDPADPGKTIEGYSAPQRAIVIAQKPHSLDTSQATG